MATVVTVACLAGLSACADLNKLGESDNPYTRPLRAPEQTASQSYQSVASEHSAAESYARKHPNPPPK